MRAVGLARVTLVIGPMEAGKSTLLAQLARDLAGAGRRVAIVDCDVGQSEIGPPTTIGLGRATPALRRLGDAELVALHFVGTTSPARDLRGVVRGARRMLDRAAGFERVLIDTSGLVSGDLGRALKQAKIDALDPDLIVALESAGECAAILARYAGRARPAIVQVPALPSPRRRSTEDRRRHRVQSLARYLAPARRAVLDLRRVAIRAASGHVVTGALGDLPSTLAGLDDRRGETLGIGVIRAIDVATSTLEIDTPVAGEAIAVVTIGRERVDGEAGGAGAAGPTRVPSPRGGA